MTMARFSEVDVLPAVPARARHLYARLGKRALDIAAVLLALPVAVPIILLAGLAMAPQGGLFGQTRVGRGGKTFTCWKIRTMVADAEAVLDKMIREDAAVAAEWRRAQKLERDPRITPLGRILRKTSLDELPQLWNVLAGDMSLVGPRPFLPAQRALYDRMPGAHAYYALRPGLTGRWQVDCRNDDAFDARAAHDHAYAQTMSLGGDLGIILRTVGVVLGATGK